MKRKIKENLLTRWIGWYFRVGPGNLFSIWIDILRFTGQFFSIAPLFKTLISPWKRISEPYRGLADISENFQIFILNTFSRVIGFFIRSFIIIIGILALILVFIGGILAFIVWFLLPFLIIFGILLSISLLY